jgi:plastocyanin
MAEDLLSVTKYETDYARCVLRLRYNISTDDYDPWNTDATFDDDPDNGVASPVTENPTVDIGADLKGLKLAINTAQFGRTFQDRSHVFYIRRRAAGITAGTGRIVNLNVRGKRGNIVQTYPSVEYDYVPNRVHVDSDTVIHLQWTGSNTHNNGNPGGDGQTGDAGEGTGGTDRHNFVQMDKMDQSYPVPLDSAKYIDSNIIATADVCYDLYGARIGDGQPSVAEDWIDCAVWLSTSGQFRTADSDFTDFQTTLDTAPASLLGGVVFQVPTAGSYNYMCTRNNNFSNRSQKGTIVVDP